MSRWGTATAPDGRVYYYDRQTGERTWNRPDDFEPPPPIAADQAAIDAAWKTATDPKSGRLYYWNEITKKTSYDAPEAYLKQQQQRVAQAAPPPTPNRLGGPGFGGRDENGGRERRMDRRDERDHLLPQRPGFEGGRGGGGVPWESRPTGYQGPTAVLDEPDHYTTPEQREEAFFKLLKKHEVSPDLPWEEAMRLVIREPDFRAIKDAYERRLAFEKYCQQVRAEEKTKEKERKEKLREDFRKMLSTHDDIKHYTLWRTARASIEREAVFKQASNDDERWEIFEEYMSELRRKHAQQEAEDRKSALEELDSLLQVLITDPNTTWAKAQEVIKQNDRFTSNDIFQSLHNLDILQAFENHLKGLDQLRIEEKQREKRMVVRRARKAREAFRELLQDMIAQGKLTADSKWQDFYPLIADDERYINMLEIPGSTPLDFFWDAVEEEDAKMRRKRNDCIDVLAEREYEMTINTTFEEFAEVMSSSPRTSALQEAELRMIYPRIMEKIIRREEEERASAERHMRKAVDALRSVIRHLDPPVRSSDTYEDIVPRLAPYEEFQALDDKEARRSAFEKHIRRLKEKEQDELERERERSRRERDRDRDRDYRNGSRRADRDDRDERDRRHHERTPEVDAYEADRRKAQAERERHYRKASFGLTPPPRERRDDRYEDRRRYESVYDRERREREMERERNYISRADPRDKGRTLDYGDDDVVVSRPGSVRKRRESEVSSRDNTKVRPRVVDYTDLHYADMLPPAKKRARRTPRTPEADPGLPKDEPELQSGSEEGEMKEV